MYKRQVGYREGGDSNPSSVLQNLGFSCNCCHSIPFSALPHRVCTHPGFLISSIINNTLLSILSQHLFQEIFAGKIFYAGKGSGEADASAPPARIFLPVETSHFLRRGPYLFYPRRSSFRDVTRCLPALLLTSGGKGRIRTY